jgi:hypothetical protein
MNLDGMNDHRHLSMPSCQIRQVGSRLGDRSNFSFSEKMYKRSGNSMIAALPISALKLVIHASEHDSLLGRQIPKISHEVKFRFRDKISTRIGFHQACTCHLNRRSQSDQPDLDVNRS